ncbi:MAG: beta-lactamase family protein, partial [Proteobacteria bacterium]|nr:beta-lactamase family protein [Pseudomonadota bacterium]
MLGIRNWLPVATALLFVIPVQAFNADDLNDPKVVEAFVDGVVKPLMAEGHSPSGVFVLMKDGEVILQKGYGWQNVEERIPVDPARTLFRPGSISKLFTWVSVMQLVEQGRLDLDADINNYLKTFQIKDTFPGQPITLRHCMTHTPGFEDGFLGYLIIEDPENIISLADAMKKYQPERVNPPGIKGAYSNYCTSLSGLVVANVSGVSFNDYVETNIFNVLGMDNSSFDEPLPVRLEQYMAVAYKYDAGKYVARPYELITNFTPAGALAATAEDMLKFGDALLNGGSYDGRRILKAETLDQMKMSHFTYDDRIKGIGLGFLRYPWGDTDTFGHDGGTTAFFSHLGITPSANLVIF